MKKKRLFFYILAVTGIISINARASTYYLAASSSDQTSAFQALVNAAATGDQIILETGSHYLGSTVSITKSITITGQTDAIVRKSNGVSCIDLNCDYITMDNVYIDGGGLNEPCMRVYSDYNTITSCTFRNGGVSGLMLHTANNNTIYSCKAYYNYVVGISQYASSDNTIANCQMYENGGEGLTIDCNSHNCMVYDNWIHKNNLEHRGVGGIGIDQSNGAWIHDNTIDYNGYHGVRFQNNEGACDGVRIYDNDNISYNEGCAVSARTDLYDVTNFGWWGNTCTGNSDGTLCGIFKSATVDYNASAANENINEENILLYPNPVTNNLCIDNICQITNIKIVNISGQLLYTAALKEENTMTIECSNFVTGTYIMYLTDKTGNVNKRLFIKE